MGNLNFRTSQDELAALLSPAGEIVDIHLPTDRMSGQPRGFAFVEFSTDDQAAAAIEQFNGHELGGRELRINEAEERPPRSGGGGGGGGRGGPGGGRGGPGGGRGGPSGRPKGSRRGLRGKKRSL